MNIVEAVLLSASKTKHPFPTKDETRLFHGNFCGLVCPWLDNNPFYNILFTPAYVAESKVSRDAIRKAYSNAGFTHFPLSPYNTVGIYHDFYPQWDDTRINDYLLELLRDGLIPVCSAFSDNTKTVKPVVDPDLVPAVFTGWENPWPIIRPKKDADNLFYVASQYFTKSIVYWHNPSGQGAPYYYAPDWGYPAGTELNHVVWDYIVNECGCQGLLAQNNGWEVNGDTSVARLQDFAWRFGLTDGTPHNGWPKADLVDFEEVAYYNTQIRLYNPFQPVLTGLSIRKRVPQLSGYCNG